MSDRFTSAIIVAAGDSTRMGFKMSKQLIPLNGRAAIEYTLKAFQNCRRILYMAVDFSTAWEFCHTFLHKL